jgi:predicted amidohydrolase YtcJ
MRRGSARQPYNTLMKAGVPVAIGTDNSPASGLFAIWSAIARKNRDTGRVMNAAEKLSRQDALRAMTANGAYLGFEEKVRGSIEKGKYADLAVLAQDYMRVPEDDIRDIQVVMTMLGGKIVYQRP